MKTYLGQGQLVGAAKEGRGISQQRIELLGGGIDDALKSGGALLVGLAVVGLGVVTAELGDEGVGEEGDAGARQGSLRIARGRRDQVRRERVGQEVGHDGRLGDDLVAVRQRRHQPSRVHLEVLGRARHRQVDDLLLVGHAELGQGNVRAVSPC